jgi:hypothetical protein
MSLSLAKSLDYDQPHCVSELAAVVGGRVRVRAMPVCDIQVGLVADLEAEEALAQDIVAGDHDVHVERAGCEERHAEPPVHVHERRYVRHHVQQVCGERDRRRARPATRVGVVLGQDTGSSQLTPVKPQPFIADIHAVGKEVHELGLLLRVTTDSNVDVPSALREVRHEVEEWNVDVRGVLPHCGAPASASTPAQALGHIRVWLLTDISIDKP